MKILIILFLLIFFLRVNNSQFTPITPETTLLASVVNPIFSRTPYSSDSRYCNQNSYNIQIEAKGVSITSASTNNTNFKLNQKFQTNDKYLYNLISYGSLEYGIYYQELTFTTNDNNNHTYQFMTTCSDLNIDDLFVISETKPFHMASSYYYYLKISGIKPHFPIEIYTDYVSGVNILHSGDPIYNYVIQLSLGALQNLSQDINFNLKFSNNRLFPISIGSYFSQFDEQDLATSHIDTFYPPNILSPGLNFTQFSYFCGPVFQSILNTNIMRPYQLIRTNSGEKYTLPLKGKKGNMTFIGFVVNGNSTFINEDGFSINNSSISVNIQDIILPKIYSTTNSCETLYINPIPVYSVTINVTEPYQFTDFTYGYFSSEIRGWPYGFYSGNNNYYTHKVSLVQLLEYSKSDYYSFGITDGGEFSVQFSPLTLDQSNSPPKLLSYQFTRVSSQKYILRLTIESVNGIRNFMATEQLYVSIDTLVSGTIYNGTFELITGFHGVKYVIMFDLYGYSSIYNPGDIVSIDPLVIFQLPQEISYKLNISNFQNNNIRFLKNNLSLEEDSYNILYVNSSDIPPYKTMALVLLDIISFPIERDMTDVANMLYRNPFIYNASTGIFECKFILPKNNMFGNIQYMIEHSPESGFYSTDIVNELFVDKTELDNQGPIFSSFEKIGNGLVISTTGTIGWKFNITDDLNGFESGYIKVMGSIDSSTYHFNFTIDDVIGDKFNCQYQILINITQPCISQEYRIVRVILFDTNKIASRFNLYTPSLLTASIINPFINFLERGIGITVLPFTCSILQVIENIKPTLLSFTTSATTIDVGATNRTISFDFSIDSGVPIIKIDQLPIIYITSLFNGLVECKSKLVSYNITNVSYSCATELPLGFGFPNALIFSVYGIVNNGGYYYGYSSDDIQRVPLSNYYINTTFTINQPVIKSTDRYYSDDNGELVIYGRGFSKVSRIDFVYSDSSLTPNSASLMLIHGSSAIRVGRIKNTKSPFYIKALTIDGFISNEFIVNPVYFNSTIIPTPTPIPTTTPIPTITPIPTNPPQKCLGNPECGGKNQGYCSSTGCICYSPWIGVTCTSQIIIVPQPSINTTKPDVEIPTDNNGQSSETNSEESQKMIFKSLISLVSLRELDFNNKEVNNYKFDQWIYTPINEFKNQYFTTVSNTNITATLEWFNQSTPIQFANQNLTMNPSSIKYTIEITEYQFKSSLNQLQLVMEASLTTNSNDICTSNQFGNTSTGDDSNYLKIQIENHSLYGRFIKRAIIDNTVKSISNVLLDSSLNVIDSSSSSLQSFIGITIPNYRNSIIVDPDFSVLIDSKSASDEDNSVCTKSNSGLTTAQLAGIIVGSIAFAAVIIIGVIYIIIKKNKQKKFVDSVNRKMAEMNKN